jgi:ParB-like chromosome segregation protein Spo0J
MTATPSKPPGTRLRPADRVERRPISRLTAYANNRRVHSEAGLDKLAADILEWGWTMPVQVDESTMPIAGHLPVRAAERLALTSIPMVVARGWSEAEKRAHRLADNQLAARASRDPEQRDIELPELGLSGFDFDLIGFEFDPIIVQHCQLITGPAARNPASGHLFDEAAGVSDDVD